MTNSATEAERALFEAWAREQGLIAESFGIMSVSSHCDTAWRAWQAARAIPLAAAEPLDMILPCDITVGNVTIRKGCKLGTLVTRMRSLHRMAMAAIPKVTPEQRAEFEQIITEIHEPPAAPDRVPSNQPEHEGIVCEGATLVCTACGTTSPAMSEPGETMPGTFTNADDLFNAMGISDRAPSTDSATERGAALGAALCDGYMSGSCTSKPKGGATITLHYLSNDQAEAAFNGISDGIDAHIRAIAAMKGEA